MAYTYKREDVFGFADSVRADVREQGKELFFKECPYCRGGGSHKDKNTFSVNLETGAFKCFRSSCGKQGHFVELARDFHYELDFGQDRQYRSLPQRKFEVKPAAVKYLESRGISQAVTERYKITTCKGNDHVLVFPFYDENGVLTFVKYRNTKYNGTGNKEWCEKGTKPILFGMEQCVGFKQLVITEGQIDSLSLAECGIRNAVSVPTGALGFTWVSNVWDWISKFAEIVVFGDWERGKMSLLDELQKRLPNKIRAVRQEDYLGEKDANDILRKYGKPAILKAVKDAVVPPVKHVVELADVEAVDIYKLPKIKTNIPDVDKLLGGLYYGQVVLLTGKRGEGKSTFMSQIMLEAIEQGIPSFAYSGELTGYHFKRWMDLQAAGQKHIKTDYDGYHNEIYSIPPDVVDKINGWYRGKAYLYDNNSIVGDEFESLVVTVEKAVRQYGIKLVCVDNLMTALDAEMHENLYQAQSKFVHTLKRIAVKYDAVVILVAHPRKSDGYSKKQFDNDEVAGSADITNRVDVVMHYKRYDREDLPEEGRPSGLLSVTKNRLTGALTKKEIPLFYSKSTKRISGQNGAYRTYGWEAGYDALKSQFDDLPF